MKQKTVVSIIVTATLITSLVLVGCGTTEDDNSQPIIGSIADKTVDVGEKTDVIVNVTDVDVDDTHIINASSDDTTVATVSVRGATLIVTGMAAGNATVTISTTDDSGQDNAAAIPVTFEVTVNLPRQETFDIRIGVNQPPPSLIDKGGCAVGMTLKPGESCSYRSNEAFAENIFYVLEDGDACREQVPVLRGQLPIPEDLRPRNIKFCVGWNIERDDAFGTHFAASKNPDGSWTVRAIP